jgi:hypothetical protein
MACAAKVKRKETRRGLGTEFCPVTPLAFVERSYSEAIVLVNKQKSLDEHSPAP